MNHVPAICQKHVGRPCTTRRQAPGEVDHRRGGKKITRHGAIMHRSYCGEADHNKKGCKYLKAGLPPPSAVSVPPPEQDAGNVLPPEQGDAAQTTTSTEADPVLTQVTLCS